MNDPVEVLRFCACCPAPCRSAIPAGIAVQAESATPTGLALITLAVLRDALPLDAGTRAALGQLEAARACATACPYGHDIPAVIGNVLTTRC